MIKTVTQVDCWTSYSAMVSKNSLLVWNSPAQLLVTVTTKLAFKVHVILSMSIVEKVDVTPKIKHKAVSYSYALYHCHGKEIFTIVNSVTGAIFFTNIWVVRHLQAPARDRENWLV